MTSEITANKELEDLQRRIAELNKSYNPDDLDLHFDNLARVDSLLFEELSSIGLSAWNLIKDIRPWTREYAYWFYNYFLLVARASVVKLYQKSPQSYAEETIEKLALLLVEIAQITTDPECGGDITKRNYEALSNLLLAFGNFRDLRKKIISKADGLEKQQVIHFVKGVLGSIREHEKKKAVD